MKLIFKKKKRSEGALILSENTGDNGVENSRMIYRRRIQIIRRESLEL